MSAAEPIVRIVQHFAPELPEIPMRDRAAAVIVQTVAKAYAVTTDMIMGERKTTRLAEARQVAIWLVRKHAAMGSSVAGEFFGRDTSSVIHAVRKCESRRAAEPDFLVFSNALEAAALARIGGGDA